MLLTIYAMQIMDNAVWLSKNTKGIFPIVKNIMPMKHNCDAPKRSTSLPVAGLKAAINSEPGSIIRPDIVAL